MRLWSVTAVLEYELGPFTIADWHALASREDGKRLELLEGHWLATPPPSGQHQAASLALLVLLREAIGQANRTDLHALGGIGIEISTPSRTALIPDIAVLDTRPIGASFAPRSVRLVGEIWSPGHSFREQHDKHAAYASAGVPFFWSITQDTGGPVELTAYELEHGHYVPKATAKAGEGPVTITASPVPVTLDVASLRP
jgi:Uma2 family endonuclease